MIPRLSPAPKSPLYKKHVYMAFFVLLVALLLNLVLARPALAEGLSSHGTQSPAAKSTASQQSSNDSDIQIAPGAIVVLVLGIGIAFFVKNKGFVSKRAADQAYRNENYLETLLRKMEKARDEFKQTQKEQELLDRQNSVFSGHIVREDDAASDAAQDSDTSTAPQVENLAEKPASAESAAPIKEPSSAEGAAATKMPSSAGSSQNSSN